MTKKKQDSYVNIKSKPASNTTHSITHFTLFSSHSFVCSNDIIISQLAWEELQFSDDNFIGVSLRHYLELLGSRITTEDGENNDDRSWWKVFIIYNRMISGEKMNKCEDTHGSDIHYQAIFVISNTFRKTISEESIIISLDVHWTKEMIT